MTTPQNNLYRIEELLRGLIKRFESDDDGNDIFDTITDIEIRMKDIVACQLRQEGLLSLIVMLLSKNDK